MREIKAIRIEALGKIQKQEKHRRKKILLAFSCAVIFVGLLTMFFYLGEDYVCKNSGGRLLENHQCTKTVAVCDCGGGQARLLVPSDLEHQLIKLNITG